MRREPYLEELRAVALCKLARRADVVLFRPQARARLRRGGTIRQHLREVIANPPIPVQYTRPVVRAAERSFVRRFTRYTWAAFLMALVSLYVWIGSPGDFLWLMTSVFLVFMALLTVPAADDEDHAGRWRRR